MDSSLVFFIMIPVVLALGASTYFLLQKITRLKEELKSDDKSTVLMEWLKQMKDSVDKSTQTMSQQLSEQRATLDNQMRGHRQAMENQTKTIWERLDKSQDVVREVQKQLGAITEFGADMKDLSNVLKSPKLRGGLGEQFLYEILENYLPKELYKTQYKFKDGNICDAVIVTDKGLIPIDSKFPMENFSAMATAVTPEARDRAKKAFVSDVKKRVDEIASKYLIPEEHTTDQAVMYIPSENVYYELVVHTQEVEDYCKKKSVVMASPNTLSYLLKILLVAYQRHELQKHTQEILKAISGIKVESEKFGEDMNVLEHHVSNTYKSMDNLKNKYGKLTTKIERAAAIESEVEVPLLQEISKQETLL